MQKISNPLSAINSHKKLLHHNMPLSLIVETIFNFKSRTDPWRRSNFFRTQLVVFFLLDCESGKCQVTRFELHASSYPILELPATGSGNSEAGNWSQSSTLNRIERKTRW